MTTEALTIDKLVDMYVKLRDHKRNADQEFKKSMEKVNKGLEKLDALLLAKLQENGVQSFSTANGTAYIRRFATATVTDAAAFKEFCESNDEWGVADIKANKAAVRKLLDEGVEVPGVKFTEVDKVGVNRGSNNG